MKAVLFTIIGGVVGLIGGTYIRILVTDLVIAPLIVPLVHPSAQRDERYRLYVPKAIFGGQDYPERISLAVE